MEGPPHFLRTASTSQVKPAETSGEACLPSIPDAPPVISIPTITLTESTPLWANLPTPIHSDSPKSMEQFDQAYGYILYRHQLPAAISGNLVLDELHDYAQIYLNGKLAGILDRRHNQSTLPIATTGPARLDILVENSDRINFSPAMRDEIKGITKSVTLAGQLVTGWQIYTLPMNFEDVSSRPERSGVERPPHFSRTTTNPPGTPTFYRGHFTLTTAGDTFLDIRNPHQGSSMDQRPPDRPLLERRPSANPLRPRPMAPHRRKRNHHLRPPTYLTATSRHRPRQSHPRRPCSRNLAPKSPGVIHP